MIIMQVKNKGGTMQLLEKLKLLFKIRRPVGELFDQIKDIKRGYKTIAFWVTLIGSILSTAAALTGVIPAPVQLVVTTVLTAFYNILRGAQKMEETAVRGTFRSTEVWLTALGEIQKGIVATQAGGINPEWLATASTIVGMSLAAGQNLAAQDVKDVPVADGGREGSPT